VSQIDEKAIRTLARLLEETALSELEYQTETFKIRVVKAASVAYTATQAVPPLPGPSSTPEDSSYPIASPMVGTVHLSPEPGAPPMIRVGDAVKEGQSLMIVEAMKVMNTIRAPREGTIKRLCVEDGQPVEFGEVLAILA
jgi:acetyl-CoA carboxylase biotin carboxyl carrier protein